MNDKEVRTQIGLYDIPRNADHPDDKVVNLFTKLKRKAEQSEAMPQSPELNNRG